MAAPLDCAQNYPEWQHFFSNVTPFPMEDWHYLEQYNFIKWII